MELMRRPALVTLQARGANMRGAFCVTYRRDPLAC